MNTYDNLVSDSVLMELDNRIESILNGTGIFYRYWSRIKSGESIRKKFSQRTDKSDYKMQDLIGCRIVCYFEEDIGICEKLFCERFYEREKDRSIDEIDIETFKPIRRNYVFDLPEDVRERMDASLWSRGFDITFECQFRTVLSEGWHEVEHDLRYKHKEPWTRAARLSRELNGILATLQSGEWTLLKVCDDLAYKCYKEKEWTHMLRNKARIRFLDDEIPQNITEILDNDSEVGKRLLNFDKLKLLMFLANAHLPLTMRNVIYCINGLEIHNASLEKLTPQLIKERLNNAMCS
ncbi:MAG: RelA/SpoT family protein [Clostridia bacterium]|nr:RelA/SpoT family protein [Clostridia bacterium]